MLILFAGTKLPDLCINPSITNNKSSWVKNHTLCLLEYLKNPNRLTETQSLCLYDDHNIKQ